MELFVPNFELALPQEFYLAPTEEVARNLLGKILVKKIDANTYLCAQITETEAYLHTNDLASHSASGKSKRNSAMFEKGGILYVYFIYGVHYCINVVTEEENKGCAVLIRKAKPLRGIEFFIKNRKTDNLNNLLNGPAKIAQAFNFTLKDNFSSLLTPSLFIQKNFDEENFQICTGKRIGITKSADLPLRFYIKEK